MSKEVKEIRCKSGVMGSRYRLRYCYNSFEEFKGLCDILNLHGRLGYKTPETAWRYNPMVESSVNPSDYRKVVTHKQLKLLKIILDFL